LTIAGGATYGHFPFTGRTLSMPTATPITRQTAGRTFIIAVSILGAGAVLQFAAICWTFIVRHHSAPPLLAETAVALDEQDVPAEARLAPTPVLPDFSGDLLGEPTPTPAPGAGAAPKPALLATQTPKLNDPTTTERFTELVEQGKMLRDRGDTGAALTKFREAQVLEARNPRAFAEIALTYEKMGLADRANEQWKRVYDLGDAAGALFIAAEAKLKAAQASELSRVMKQNTSAPDEAPAGTVRGAPVSLATVGIEEVRDPGASKKFTLRVPIKARFGTKVDANDLAIQVRFYDVVDSARVETTGANVSYRWGAPPPDWTEGDTEELLAQYELPIEKRNRKYFGYLVRLYYKGELQSATGTPETLVQKYPPPPTLQNEPTP
jgi:tetratricopeptide (TPR) repeat protein